MTASRLARRLGMDGNPLRRPTDKFAAWLGALLVVVFIIGAPAGTRTTDDFIERRASVTLCDYAGGQSVMQVADARALVEIVDNDHRLAKQLGVDLLLVLIVGASAA